MCMAAARIAILALLVSVSLRAQSPSKLEIKVTDASGTPIPRARVQARSSEPGITSAAETDAQGEAVLYLGPDTSTISVRAPGFDGWQYKMDAREKLDNPFIAVLRIASYYGPTLVNAEPGLETEPQSPITAVIPLEPLAYLIDLPPHKSRHHCRAHSMAN